MKTLLWLISLLWLSMLLASCGPDARALRDLQSNDQAVRLKAIEVLRGSLDGKSINKKVVNALARAMNDEDEQVALAAASAIKHLSRNRWLKGFVEMDDVVIAAWVSALGNKRRQIQEMADEQLDHAFALPPIDKRPLSTLSANLTDPNVYVRRQAARALAARLDLELESPDAVKSLIAPLTGASNDDDDRVREAVVGALGSTKDARVVPTLLAALNDRVEGVRRHAAGAFGKTWDRRAIGPLTAALDDPTSSVRSTALGVLCEFGGPEVIPSVLEAVRKHKHLREPVTLARTRDSRVAGILTEMLEDDHIGTRRGAVEALATVRATSAVPTLVALLTDWDLSEQAAAALVTLGWTPLSDADRVHMLLAQRKGRQAKRDWDVTKRVLMEDIASGENRRLANAVFSTVALGKEEMIQLLIEKLNVDGTKTMAEAYLNSGHDGLANAAKQWASSHGYIILSGQGAAPVRWGAW
jgi:HEAT repeat protein